MRRFFEPFLFEELPAADRRADEVYLHEIRRRFTDTPGLLAAVYTSLVAHLEEQQLLLTGPFDAARCLQATLKDLDEAAMKAFVRDARASRGFPLKKSDSGRTLLTHLNLLEMEAFRSCCSRIGWRFGIRADCRPR